MTVATMEVAISALRKEVATLTALVKERLPVPTPLPALVVAPPIVEAPLWALNPDNLNMTIQAKDPSRVSVVGKAVRLETKPGDNNIFGSGAMERCDLSLSQALTDGFEGREAWWHQEILFPDDFQQPRWYRYVIFDFHHTGPTGQANFHLGFERGPLDIDTGRFGFQGFGGVQDQGKYGAIITSDMVARNRWIAFDYHVRWASDASGFFDAWVNGKNYLRHKGPTLYQGQGVYLKLANYHVPVCDPYPACVGTHKASAVMHAEVRRGKTSMANTALE